MAHEIETFADGTAAFASARTDAWHKLGTTLDDVFTAEQAMHTARLGGWNVRKAPLAATVDEHQLNVDAYATVRTNPATGQPEALGVVGEQYTVVQNEQLCGFLNAVTDESGAHYETAGSLRKGREVFVTAKLPDTMTIGGVDDLDLYIAGLNSHDGGSAVRMLVTPVRIVCANTQAAALGNAKAAYALRHTSGVQGRAEEARQALGLTWRYLADFQAEAEKMIDQTLTDGKFLDIIKELWPLPEEPTDRQRSNHDRLLTQFGELFTEADTQANIRGTRWAGYQTVTEYLDHYAPVRGTNPDAARAERTLTSDATRATKEKAFAAFSS